MVVQGIEAVFIDHDGTLVDTLPWIHGIFIAFCESQNITPPTLEEVITRKEHDWHEQLVNLNRGYRGTREDAVAFFRKHEKEQPYPRKLYPGAKAALEVFAFHKVPMYLLTLNEREFVEPHLKALGIHPLFSGLEFQCKNKGAAIRDVCGKMGISPQRCAFIGDVPSDVRDGRYSEVLTIAYLNGLVGEHHFEGDSQPHHKVRSFSEIITILIPESIELFHNAHLYGEHAFLHTG